MSNHSFISHKSMLFGAKTTRFPIVFTNSKNYPIDNQVFAKSSNTRLFSTSRLFFQKNARF
jgi:hypothetical protein